MLSAFEGWLVTRLFQIGFPVLTVTETEVGITVRQDRLLETGIAEKKDNETIWYVSTMALSQPASYAHLADMIVRNVPLFVLTMGANGVPAVDSSVVLDAREKLYTLDTSGPFKLNAGTSGFCKSIVEPERSAVH